MAIQWFPGHMHLTRQAIAERIKQIDVVIEMLDARLPGSSANPMLQQLTGHKPTLKVLNKQDLADPAVTAQWLAHYQALENTRALALDTAHTQAALGCLNPPGLKGQILDCGGFVNAWRGGIRQSGAFEMKQVTWAFNHAKESPLAKADPVVRAALDAEDIKAWFKKLPWLDDKHVSVFCTYAHNPGGTIAGLSKVLEGKGAVVVGGQAIKRSQIDAEHVGPFVADQFEATLVWMAEQEMLPGRPYLLKIGTQLVSATITEPKYKVNVNTMEHLAAKQLEMNEIGVVNLALDRPIAFDPYTENRDTGGFILINRMTNNTLQLARLDSLQLCLLLSQCSSLASQTNKLIR